MTDPKPELGYTGHKLVYQQGYEIRIRVYKVLRSHRPSSAHWQTKVKWDVFHHDELLVEATSLRLAEEYILRKVKGR